MTACGQSEEKYQKVEYLFGTDIMVTVYDKDENHAKKSLDDAFKEMKRIDSSYNTKVPTSLLSKLNKDGKVQLNEEGIMLLNKVKEGYTISKGKYDITAEPLLKCWGFENSRNTLPTKEELEKAKENIDFSKIKIDGNEVVLMKKGLTLDTGSFLKGYAVERARDILKKDGIRNGYVTALSSIASLGAKADGTPWKIGIQNPNNPSKIIGIVELNGGNMGVSGDYQLYVEINGKRYHHIMDKSSGYPVSDKKMVVVVNKNSLDADILSTTFFLMPISEVLKYVESKPDLEVLIVDSNDKIFTSKGMKFKKID